MARATFFIVTLVVAAFSVVSYAQEPQWTGRVIKSGAEREIIDALPIELRPYRPLHFYGNTVRRQYYRGTSAPAPRDFLGGASAFVGRR